MVQTGAFLADMSMEPTIAVDSLSGMIMSFIIPYWSWRAHDGFLEYPEAQGQKGTW
jgi:hypothetical protein